MSQDAEYALPPMADPLTKADADWWESETAMLKDSLGRALKEVRSLVADADWWRSAAEVAARMLRDTEMRPTTDDEATIIEWARRLPGPRPSQRHPARTHQQALGLLLGTSHVDDQVAPSLSDERVSDD